ncbi:MAG: site-specific integrase [Chlorobium sp.]|nr:MAG: site-specific integrase [Chlorobium sp.]
MGVSVREIALKEGGVSFSIDIYFKGQRQQVKTDIQAERSEGREYKKARQQAEARAAELEAQLKIDPAAVFLGKERRGNDFLEYFKKVMNDEKKSESSYRNALKHLRDFNGVKPLPMANICQTWAERFRAYVDGLSLKETTKQNYLLALKIILKRAAEENLIPDFSRKIKQFGKNDVALKYLTVEQIKTLEATPCSLPAIKAAFLFSCFSGLRVSDLEALKDGDIQQDGDRVTIRFKAQKTQRWERLTLGAQALKYLDEAKEQHKDRETEDSRVFLLPSRAWSVKVVRAWGAAAGIPFNLGFHCGRHSFAVLSLQNGVDLYTLSKLMGHATISATQIYAKVVDETKTAAMDKLPSW